MRPTAGARPDPKADLADTARTHLAAPRPAANDSLLGSDARKQGYAPLDATHQAFYTVVLHLLACDAGTATTALAAFEAHAVAHFRQEEAWMHDTAFPAAGCHADEHAAVLASVHEVQALLADGRAGPPLLHRLAEHLLVCFRGHADHMDSALAGWMVQRSHGVRPWCCGGEAADRSVVGICSSGESVERLRPWAHSRHRRG